MRDGLANRVEPLHGNLEVLLLPENRFERVPPVVPPADDGREVHKVPVIDWGIRIAAVVVVFLFALGPPDPNFSGDPLVNPEFVFKLEEFSLDEGAKGVLKVLQKLSVIWVKYAVVIAAVGPGFDQGWKFEFEPGDDKYVGKGGGGERDDLGIRARLERRRITVLGFVFRFEGHGFAQLLLVDLARRKLVRRAIGGDVVEPGDSDDAGGR